MAHMPAIKLYTRNMVDCQQPGYKWSLSDFEKLSWSSTHFCKPQQPQHPARSPKRGILLDRPPCRGRVVHAHLPKVKAVLCKASRGFPVLHTHFMNQSSHPLACRSKALRPSLELGFSFSELAPCSLPSIGSRSTSQLQTPTKSLPSSYML